MLHFENPPKKSIFPKISPSLEPLIKLTKKNRTKSWRKNRVYWSQMCNTRKINNDMRWLLIIRCQTKKTNNWNFPRFLFEMLHFGNPLKTKRRYFQKCQLGVSPQKSNKKKTRCEENNSKKFPLIHQKCIILEQKTRCD